MSAAATQSGSNMSEATTPPDQKSIRTSTSDPSTQNTLNKIVLARHSTRAFQQHIPVPVSIIEECLEIAQHSPSSTNLQPWRMTFTAGARLDKLRKAMLAAVTSGVPSTVPPIPDRYTHYRSDLGHAMYGPDGWNVPRGDRDGTRKAQLRNYEFFGAPMVAVVGIDQELVRGADVMSVGLYVQTLVLLLTERGLGTCLLVSTSGYPDVLRKELGIPENVVILCTLSIGYEDEAQHVNSMQVPRDQWKEHVDFVMD